MNPIHNKHNYSKNIGLPKKREIRQELIGQKNSPGTQSQANRHYSLGSGKAQISPSSSLRTNLFDDSMLKQAVRGAIKWGKAMNTRAYGAGSRLSEQLGTQSQANRHYSPGSGKAQRNPSSPLRTNLFDDSLLQQAVRGAIKWGKAMDTRAYGIGSRLSEQQREIARQMGVRDLDRVRVVIGDIPKPTNLAVVIAMQQFGMMDQNGMRLNGLTFGHSIYIKSGLNIPFAVALSHELRHVKQNEDLGSMEAFLTAYINEINSCGYEGCSFEQDAFQHQLSG